MPCFILRCLFHATRFVSLHWLNSTVEFKATNGYRSKHPKLKVAGVCGGSKLLQGFLTAKGEGDKEERDG